MFRGAYLRIVDHIRNIVHLRKRHIVRFKSRWSSGLSSSLIRLAG
jgi:hypothetical protein